MFIKNFLFLIFPISFIIGCGGEKPVSVEGKFTIDGKPVELKKTATIQITFHATENNHAQAISYPADFENENLIYKINNIPKGRYKVEIVYLDPYPSRDRLNGSYSASKSPIVCELKDNTTFDINILSMKK